MNDVEALPQMKRASPNEVALCANGIKPFAWCAEILLIFNRKCDIIVFRKAVNQ